MNKRVIFSDNGTLTDLSTVVNKYSSASAVLPLAAAEDAIYIGSRLPFNHLYFKLSTPSVAVSTMTVQYCASNWTNVVELIDETDGFTKSGFITFVPNRNAGWSMKTTTKEVSELNSVEIYDLYWLKITFSADLDLTTALAWCGNLFNDDLDLGAEYPDLLKSGLMTAFQAGKTSWEEQNVRAGEILINDMISKNIIDDSDQILVKDDYKNAAVCKVAEIVYGAFGDDFVDQKARARAEYDKRLTKRVHIIDTNATGAEEVAERRATTGWMRR